MRFHRGKLPGSTGVLWKTPGWCVRFHPRKLRHKSPPGFPGAIYRVLEVIDRDPDRQAWACHENRAF